MRIISLLFAFLVVPLSLPARQGADDAAAPRLSDEIVVTASALTETEQETPASVTVITRADIEQREVRQVADVLREVPGLNLTRSGSDGKQTSLFTRGANSNHTLVLWNGIELNNPYFSGFDWGHFPVAGVDRVEVVRGPFSALYGSDAMAGVVNVISGDAPSGVSLDLAGGERGLMRAAVDGAWNGGPISGRASVSTSADDGLYPNDELQEESVTTELRWAASPAVSTAFRLRYISYDIGLPFNLNAEQSAIVPSLHREQQGRELVVAIPFQQVIGRFQYELTASTHRADDDFSDPEDPYGYVQSTTESISDRASLLTRTQTPFGTIVAGGEYDRASVDSSSNFGIDLRDDQRDSVGFFLEDRLSRSFGAAELELSVGARHDDFDTFGSHLSPRAGAAVRIGSNKFRASWGEAFRAPSVGELYFPFSGNALLEPEKSRSVEVGYDRSIGDHARFNVTLFRSDFEDLITFDNATYRFSNIGEAKTAGVELGASAHLRSLELGLTYGWLDTEQTSDGPGKGEPLLRRPRHSGTVFLSERLGAFTGSMVVRYVGDRADVLPVAPYGRIQADEHVVSDLALQYRIGAFAPYLRLENATDEQYEEVAGYPAGGRRLLLGLRYSLQ